MIVVFIHILFTIVYCNQSQVLLYSCRDLLNKHFNSCGRMRVDSLPFFQQKCVAGRKPSLSNLRASIGKVVNHHHAHCLDNMEHLEKLEKFVLFLAETEIYSICKSHSIYIFLWSLYDSCSPECYRQYLFSKL